MSAIEITISGVLYDKLSRTTRPVVLIGEASYTGLGVGGGPIDPGPGGPVHIWGPTDPRPGVGPIIPGGPGGGGPPGIWGPNDPRPSNPISGIPGLPGYEPGPPTEPPPAGVKPPPPGGGWGFHPEYGWGYFPGTSGAQPHTT